MSPISALGKPSTSARTYTSRYGLRQAGDGLLDQLCALLGARTGSSGGTGQRCTAAVVAVLELVVQRVAGLVLLRGWPASGGGPGRR